MEELFERFYTGYDQPVLDVEAVRFSLYIISFRGCVGPDRKIERFWEGLRLQQITGRNWYFRHIAAKLQIENPKRIFVFHTHRTTNEQDAQKAAFKQLVNKQVSAKAKVTQFTNRIEQYKATWNSLFPIEDDEVYQKAMAQLENKKCHLETLTKEVEALKAIQLK